MTAGRRDCLVDFLCATATSQTIFSARQNKSGRQSRLAVVCSSYETRAMVMDVRQINLPDPLTFCSFIPSDELTFALSKASRPELNTNLRIPEGEHPPGNARHIFSDE